MSDAELRELCSYKPSAPASAASSASETADLVPDSLRRLAPPKLLHALELNPHDAAHYRQLAALAVSARSG